ncbi:MAG: twin-arginine translocase subunit TatC [Deltaproteobacteria bacterium]|nr:twin-arginine translocase subunit TatC [Deltaproteobacteria bacterium]
MRDATMPLTAHLEELRWRLIKAIAAVAVAFAVCYGFSEQVFALLTRPLVGAGDEHLLLIGTGVTEAFFTRLKVTLIAAIFASSPVLFYQAWGFVAPGLYTNERRTALPFVLAGTFFFVSGAWFCYVVVFPVGYAFFLEEYRTIGVAPTIRISEYLSFASRMLLAFGVTFELPVVTFFLARIGLVTHRMLISWFRYAIVVIFIVAAVLTPGPDAASQFLMATPLVVLYIISIGVAYFFARGRAATAAPAAAGGDVTPTAR